MNKLILLFLMVASFIQLSYSQYNLITDSSFEKNKGIPLTYSAIDYSGSWTSATRATPDLFCQCSKKQAKESKVNVPNNSMGQQEAYSGKCYAGIFLVSHSYYREFIQTNLNSPLEAGKEYTFKMQVSLSDYSPLASDKIGVCFLNSTLKLPHSDPIVNLQPNYISLEEEVGLDVNDWHELSFRYKAKGGESALLIGSFAIKRIWKTGNTPPNEISSPIYKRIDRDAYYYIDDVCLYEYKPEKIDTSDVGETPYFANQIQEKPEEIIVAPDTVQKMNFNEVVSLNNVFFKSGEDILTPESFAEINILLVYLKARPNLRIELFGHTDNSGDEASNQLLSQKRAEAIGNYLIKKGISEIRIKAIGYGSSKPIDSNLTESGRKANRRVEFNLIEN
jgi:outer membrane protein OmpA-like peptidoglycan-associated protein